MDDVLQILIEMAYGNDFRFIPFDVVHQEIIVSDKADAAQFALSHQQMVSNPQRACVSNSIIAQEAGGKYKRRYKGVFI